MGSLGPPPFFVVKSGNRWTRIYVMREAILVIDRGTVVDVGPHSHLMSGCTTYRHLWNQQQARLAG